ncbi:hypothetical protein B0T18DRAFT_448814 [Schizothecium vesticola]|uniref:Uncharacterized protein n=1 Tax=Schizothecium vesticola TaxID=314040 RepID=A0AA40BTG4_9PEZI|nr:hypothetical protein B0T18DRAFT_448814 [Schizothecium vesticola]
MPPPAAPGWLQLQPTSGTRRDLFNFPHHERHRAQVPSPPIHIAAMDFFHPLSPRRIIIISSGGGSSKPAPPSAFSLAPKRPAGQVDSRPQFNLYLGVNTGPYQRNSTSVILPPIPIEWIIAPYNVTAGQCPTRAANLGLFAITNLIVFALIIILGCRPLVRFLTGGLLGQPNRWSKYWTWLFSFGLQVGSNAIVSYLIVSTPGYEHLSMLNVFALYSSRPRINQIWTGLLRTIIGPIRITDKFAIKEKPISSAEPPRRKKGSLPRRAYNWATGNWTPGQEWSAPSYGYDWSDPSREWIYTDSYISTSIAELCLQLISAVFIGVTWSRFPNEPIREHMENYYNYMLAAPAMAFIGWGLVPIWRGRLRDVCRDRFGVCWEIVLVCCFLGFCGFFTYGVAWRFWAEFLLLPGSLWCPPKFVQLAAVWSSFSGMSALFGASM